MIPVREHEPRMGLDRLQKARHAPVGFGWLEQVWAPVEVPEPLKAAEERQFEVILVETVSCICVRIRPGKWALAIQEKATHNPIGINHLIVERVGGTADTVIDIGMVPVPVTPPRARRLLLQSPLAWAGASWAMDEVLPHAWSHSAGLPPK